MRRSGGLQQHIWAHCGIILASSSTKTAEQEHSRKTFFLGEGRKFCPGPMPPSEPFRVLPRCQATPARWSHLERKTKGREQNTQHVGPHLS